MRHMRDRLRDNEGGFTLPEVLVTIMMMVVVLFALYSIFDMGIRVFAFGNDKVEAVENARLGMERMEREIRAAFPHDASDNVSTNDHLFFSTATPEAATPPSETQITFGNELNGDGKISCPNPAGRCEYITYKLSGTTLMRNATSAGSTSNTGDEAVIEFVDSGGPNGGLAFEYLGSNGDVCASTNPTCEGDDQSEIDRVRIALDIRVEGGQQDGTQTLTTDVELRNQGVTSLSSDPLPSTDGDSDGVPDHSDSCPTEAGDQPNGCPAPPSSDDDDGDGVPDDGDGDGVPDNEDACPDESGDQPDGCPSSPPPSGDDDDGDGVPNDEDACPDTFGDQADGCPPAPTPADSDNDGVPDAEDACPDEPGDQADGCPSPPPDGDGDGIPDGEDACPEEFGDQENGCPTPPTPTDSDGDGVPDDDDDCPAVPGVPPSGCPPPPTFSVNDASIAEGNDGTRNIAFTVTRSGNLSGSSTVQYATSNGTASSTGADRDYEARSGTLTFSAGESSKTVNVTVRGDTRVEQDETFRFTLSNPTGATIANGTATGTIRNDDVEDCKGKGC